MFVSCGVEGMSEIFKKEEEGRLGEVGIRSGRWADQGEAEIGFSRFAQKWLEIQLSSKNIIFSPICQLFKS